MFTCLVTQAYMHVCVCICCMLFYTLLGTATFQSRSHEQQHIPITHHAAYEDINEVNTNINPAYGETTRQHYVTYEEITMQ